MKYYVGVILFFILIISLAAYFLGIPISEVLLSIWNFILDMFYLLKEFILDLYYSLKPA